MSRTDRYARQIRFTPIGETGQQRLRDSHVAVLGCGALGTVASELLARAGIGRLTIVDRDCVEWSNLQRQSLFQESDAMLGRTKVAAAADHLAKINSDVWLNPIAADVTADNCRFILNGVDLVIDAVDNFLARFLLNDWSLATETPWVHGGCVGASGQVRLFTGLGAPCFRCLVPEPPPASAVETCDTAGVVAPATHLIASLQAVEAMKWLCGDRSSVRDNVLSVDIWNNRIREFQVEADQSQTCVACGDRYFQFLNGDHASATEAVLCGRDAVQINSITNQKVDLEQIAESWEGVGRVQMTPFFVRLHPEDGLSLTLFIDGRVIVTGTTETAEARSLYARFVGS